MAIKGELVSKDHLAKQVNRVGLGQLVTQVIEDLNLLASVKLAQRVFLERQRKFCSQTGSLFVIAFGVRGASMTRALLLVAAMHRTGIDRSKLFPKMGARSAWDPISGRGHADHRNAQCLQSIANGVLGPVSPIARGLAVGANR